MDLEFGNYRLGRAERLLLGPKGPVELSARSFDILAILLERPDEVIGKTELFDAVWPGLVVEENTLQVHVSALRKALDTGMIVTVHGRGYKYAGPRPVLAQAINGAGVPVSQAASEQLSPPPSRPSIAVLPFVNMSGDAAQDYFVDGITNNIITDLARFHDLFVIASNSSFAYKGKAVKIQDACRELGVVYILEGSVQRSGDRMRITAQLIEGATGRHLWAERYDRQGEDIFTLQDEVTQTIVGTLATAYGGRLRKAWRDRPARAGGRNFAALDYFLRGMVFLNRFTKDDNQKAKEAFAKAVELEANYGKPIAKLAWSHMTDITFGWSENPAKSWEDARIFATTAVERDDDEAWGHWAMGGYTIFRLAQHDRAIAEMQRALELNPNDADVIADYALFLSYAGRAKEAIEWALKAMRLNPHYPSWYVMQLGPIYYDARRYGDAIVTLDGLRDLETIFIDLYLAASHAQLGHEGKARKAIEHALEIQPGATIEGWATSEKLPYKDPSDLEHLRDGLRKAGLPE